MHTIMYRFWCILISLILLSACKSYGQKGDTLQTPFWDKKQVVKSLVAPGLLIGYGIIAMNDNDWLLNSKDVHRELMQRFPDFDTKLDYPSRYVPVLAVYGLNLAGVKGKHSYLSATLIFGISSTITKLLVYELKEITHVKRPDGGFQAMPSGHAADAFVSATFLYKEYQHRSAWYGVAGYAVASATGLMRMLKNRHWMSDVLVGAGIGILVTQLTYAIYPWLVERLTLEKLNQAVLIPRDQEGGLGLSMIITIP